MSIRSMLEFNHDYVPRGSQEEAEWLEKLLLYLSSGDPKHLPRGVTWFNVRHHSDRCPLGEPPRGWDNHDQKPWRNADGSKV